MRSCEPDRPLNLDEDFPNSSFSDIVIVVSARICLVPSLLFPSSIPFIPPVVYLESAQGSLANFGLSSSSLILPGVLLSDEMWT